MTSTPLVSILMPVLDRAHLLDRVLESLARNTTHPDVEILAVDDGSTDGSVQILRRWSRGGRLPGLRLIANEGNGAIDALNTALYAASGEFCVQMDSDVTVETPGWIERMLELMHVDDAVGIVTPKVVFDSGDIHTCGVSVVSPAGWHEPPATPAEPIGRRFWLNRMTRRVPEGQGGTVEHQVAEVDAGMGACMMFRRDDALAVGGYDRRYSPVWFDDVDLCIAIRALGRKAFYLPDVRVIHYFAGRRPPEGRFAPLRWRRLVGALLRQTAGRLPLRVKVAVERRVNIDLEVGFTPKQCALLRHHHAYWREKWGWDVRNPDMEEILRRWGTTEICWAYDPGRRAAGERIIQAYEAVRVPEERALRAV
jgi:GT2 family glycosyltransferase